MPSDLRVRPVPPSRLSEGGATVNIETYSYEERRIIFSAVNEAMDLCGCWLLERRPLSFTQVQFRFELHGRSLVDLYVGLIAAGLEMTRASHDDLTTLCTLRKHQTYPTSLPGVLTVHLSINFLDDPADVPLLSSGPTHA